MVDCWAAGETASTSTGETVERTRNTILSAEIVPLNTGRANCGWGAERTCWWTLAADVDVALVKTRKRHASWSCGIELSKGINSVACKTVSTGIASEAVEWAGFTVGCWGIEDVVWSTGRANCGWGAERTHWRTFTAYSRVALVISTNGDAPWGVIEDSEVYICTATETISPCITGEAVEGTGLASARRGVNKNSNLAETSLAGRREGVVSFALEAGSSSWGTGKTVGDGGRAGEAQAVAVHLSDLAESEASCGHLVVVDVGEGNVGDFGGIEAKVDISHLHIVSQIIISKIYNCKSMEAISWVLPSKICCIDAKIVDEVLDH